MSERVFRIVLGGALIVFLYLRTDPPVYAYIGVLLFEGLTNWRIPALVSRLRYGKTASQAPLINQGARCSFEAERALRLFIAAVLLDSFVLFREQLWVIPWFLGFALLLAGITGICPLAMFFRNLGLN